MLMCDAFARLSRATLCGWPDAAATFYARTDKRSINHARATERTARLADERGAAAEGAHREADQQRGVRLEGRKWRWGG